MFCIRHPLSRLIKHPDKGVGPAVPVPFQTPCGDFYRAYAIVVIIAMQMIGLDVGGGEDHVTITVIR